MTDWQGYQGWFALAAYLSILSLPLLVSGIIADIAGDVVQKTIALFATGWLFVYLVFVTPFRMWQDEKYRMNLVEESQQPKVNVNWTFNDQKRAQIGITNFSTKTINGIDVSFRNYRNPDGTDIRSVLESLVSSDGKRAPISLNPLVPAYFEFAGLTEAPDGETVISLLPETDNAIEVGKEVGVKLYIAGEDTIGSRIDFRLKIHDGNSLSIEPWDLKKPAVNVADDES